MGAAVYIFLNGSSSLVIKGGLLLNVTLCAVVQPSFLMRTYSHSPIYSLRSVAATYA